MRVRSWASALIRVISAGAGTRSPAPTSISLYTNNTDFLRFPFLDVKNPFA